MVTSSSPSARALRAQELCERSRGGRPVLHVPQWSETNGLSGRKATFKKEEARASKTEEEEARACPLSPLKLTTRTWLHVPGKKT